MEKYIETSEMIWKTNQLISFYLKENLHMITFLKENQKLHNDTVPLFSMIFISCSVVACWIFLNLVLYLKTKFKK